LHVVTGEHTARMWSEAHVLCADMEASTLFVVGTIRGLRTGAILLVVNSVGDGSIEQDQAAGDRLDPLIRTAVGAVRALIREDRTAGDAD
jgi:purine-nucleoside phosphorylase